MKQRIEKLVDQFTNGFLWVSGAIIASTIFEKVLNWAVLIK